MNEQLGRGLPIGVDDTGTSYFQLASDAGWWPQEFSCTLFACNSSQKACNLHLALHFSGFGLDHKIE